MELDGAGLVLGVQGEVDYLTAPELGAALDSLIDHRQPSVVVDLARCEFMDSSGLHMIAGRASRLRERGSTLTVRSPSATVRRLAAIMGLVEMIEQEQVRPLEVDAVDDSSSMPAAVPEEMVRYLRSSISSDGVVDAALRLVAGLARDAVGGADGASVSLRRSGVLTTVAATDQTVLDMDAGQYATGQGPCVDAANEGRGFHATSLDTEVRWSDFVPRARTLGIRAILSSPLFSRGQPCGALNIYARHPGAFTSRDQALAWKLAAQVSGDLVDMATGDTAQQAWSRFVGVLTAREALARAEGVLMEREGVDQNAAHGILRRRSVQSGMPLQHGAASTVGSTQPRSPGGTVGVEAPDG
ncbi:MAG: anti-sigma factor antagonist [Actinomycetota bacterium]|nr:anti-sigma factor antagonist [Actinomycetota bacterium]